MFSSEWLSIFKINPLCICASAENSVSQKQIQHDKLKKKDHINIFIYDIICPLMLNPYKMKEQPTALSC